MVIPVFLSTLISGFGIKISKREVIEDLRAVNVTFFMYPNSYSGTFIY